MQLSIIIINYNVKYFLEQCLYSVIRASSNIDAEIIVVDNASADGSSSFFKGSFPSVKFIWNPENIGFAKANNLALQQASGKYILFLNPDTILPEDGLEKSIAFYNSVSNIGALGIRMIDGAGNFLKESKRGLPSIFTSFCKLSGLTTLFPNSKIFAHYYLGHLDQHCNHKVEVLSGAFLMTEKKLLDKVGAFDENFFMYAEDIDLSYRFIKNGYTNYYFSGATIIHFKGESSKRASPSSIKLFYGTMGLFVKKYYSAWKSFVYTLLINIVVVLMLLFTWVKSGILNLLTRRKKEPRETLALVIAEKKDYEEIQIILQNAAIQKKVVGWVAVNNYDTHGQMGNLSELENLIKEYKISEVIFCSGILPFKEIIQLMQQKHSPVQYWFHATGSSGIIGSSNKKEQGNFITAYTIQ